ncbi:MAG TPA: hypothetical protein VJY39_05145 [Acidisphaera sp.]|nr:hypothetical protein [Acidisphaera sp.]
MPSVRALVLLLIPLAACAGAQPRPMASRGYNVPNIGGAGLTPIGTAGLSFRRTLPTAYAGTPNYNLPQTGGAGLAPIGGGGVNLPPPLLGNGAALPPAPYYNLPDSGGAGLLPPDTDGLVRRPAGQ